MFYEEDNILVARFGTGDIIIAPGHEEETNNGTISFIDSCGISHKLNSSCDFSKKGIHDTKLNTMIRFVFEETKSIDALIWALKKAKKTLMEKK